MRVIVLHNISDDAGKWLIGYSAGDPLVPVIQYDVADDIATIVAAEEAFFLFNEGDDALMRVARYRERRNRSFSVGDVVKIGDTWLACAASGWKTLDEPPVDSIVHRAVHGTTPMEVVS